MAHLRFISGITYWVLPLATEFPHLFSPGVHGEALAKKTIKHPWGITSLVKVSYISTEPSQECRSAVICEPGQG